MFEPIMLQGKIISNLLVGVIMLFFGYCVGGFATDVVRDRFRVRTFLMIGFVQFWLLLSGPVLGELHRHGYLTHRPVDGLMWCFLVGGVVAGIVSTLKWFR